MKIFLTILACLLLLSVGADGIFAVEVQPVKTLPVIVAQATGQANTVTMWHDINDDGKADYKVAYVFKNGRLYQLSRSQIFREEPVRQIQER
jgi:hypothetical protein